MAAPVAVSANTVGGGIDSSVPNSFFESTNPSRKTQRFARTFQHYISNNNESQAPSVTDIAAVTNENPAVKAIREGWYHIPYTYTKCAMTQANKDMIIFGARKFRVVEAGFNITRLVAMQQEVIPSATATRITNSFVQAPAVLMFKDTDNDMYAWTYPPNATLTGLQPIWQSPGGLGTTAGPNNNFTTPFALTAAAGSLQLTMQVPPGYNPGGGATQQFSLMHGGDVQLLQSGEKFEYSWKNPVSQWVSPHSIRPTAAQVAQGQGHFDYAPMSNSNALIAFPDDIVTLYENTATELTQNVWNQPMMHLIRVPPLFNAEGAITTVFELFIEYHVTVEWEDGRYLQSRGAGANNSAVANSGSMQMWPISSRVAFKQYDPEQGRPEPELANQARAKYKKMAI